MYPPPKDEFVLQSLLLDQLICADDASVVVEVGIMTQLYDFRIGRSAHLDGRYTDGRHTDKMHDDRSFLEPKQLRMYALPLKIACEN